MIEKLLKNKKQVGIIAILAIILIIFAVLYLRGGFNELKKNDNENIFIDNGKNEEEIKSEKQGDRSKNKDTSVQLKDKDIIVEIKGEVKKPDVYKLNEDSIVKDLIDKAGGLTEQADLSNINRAKKLQNHELVYISNINDKSKDDKVQADIVQNKEISSKNSSQNNQGNGKINLNNATIEDLKTLNGIGDAKAKNIIEYRDKNGGFKSIEELKEVEGIGDKMFEKIKDNIEI